MTNKELEQKVKELEELVLRIAEAIPKKEEKPQPAQQVNLPPEKVGKIYFPPQWRAKIDEILGKSFEADAETGANGDYLMKVYMPEGVERRPGGERTGRDLSQAIVRRATDMADVESWCNKIKNNILLTYPNLKFPL